MSSNCDGFELDTICKALYQKKNKEGNPIKKNDWIEIYKDIYKNDLNNETLKILKGKIL